jgi:hypothetical protein
MSTFNDTISITLTSCCPLGIKGWNFTANANTTRIRYSEVTVHAVHTLLLGC